ELHDSSSDPGPFQRMTNERFNAFALWGMPEAFRNDFALVSAWSAENERLLAAVVQHRRIVGKDESPVAEHAERNFFCAVFARDNHHRYRSLASFGPVFTARAAEDAIRSRKGSSGVLSLTLDSTKGPRPGMDLFATLPRMTTLHPAYRILRDGVRQAAAKRM